MTDLDEMMAVVKARQALSALLSSRSCPLSDSQMQAAMAAHAALLEVERASPRLQAQAFAQMAGPREEWEIG